MKKNLGKVVLILLIFLQLDASTYKWSAQINKSEAIVNEAIYLKYVCEFSDKSELYTIDFNPVGDYKNYSVELLAEQEKILEGKRINSYEYIVYAKREGQIVFDFDIVMKKTTQESIDATIGGRDNDRDKESFTNRYLKQKSLVVNVENSSSIIVGNFSIEVKKAKKSINSYEPYHYEIIIDGVGNFKGLKPINLNIKGVKVFSQKIIKDIKLTRDGYKGRWSQKLAFVADKNFIIPSLKIKYYDIEQKKINELVVGSTRVNIQNVYVKEELLDKKEEIFALNFDFVYYILTFIAGFILAKISSKKTKNKDIKSSIFEEKVKNTKSLERLLITLALEDSKTYKELINDIQNNKITSLSECKKIIIKLM
ncbi:hypothetical protein [Sulfurimonas sp.]|uniref:hypothetical protein n=1 Tax=Sulfurimonas sp. TaxID=2022749 RepID=UPI002B461F07|nr:hypothetical protein [Sulfurimonas sp.]